MNKYILLRGSCGQYYIATSTDQRIMIDDAKEARFIVEACNNYNKVKH